jgi:peptidoglycan-associated lipoprotein
MVRVIIMVAAGALSLVTGDLQSADACGVKLAIKVQKVRTPRAVLQARTPTATAEERKPIRTGPEGSEDKPREPVQAGGTTNRPTETRTAAKPKKPPPAEPTPPESSATDRGTTDTTASEPTTRTQPTPTEPVEKRPARGKLSRELFFANASSEISAGNRAKLSSTAEWLKSNPDKSITIEGHANTTGSPDANMTLSRSRADAVKDYLVGEGVDESRISVEAFGMERPKYSPGSSGKNRRVVIVAK